MTATMRVPYMGQRPVRAYDEPAGSDLRLANTIIIGPGQTVLVPTGTALTAPEGTFAMLALRSSMPRKNIEIPNGIGVIDPDYTGVIFVWLHNFGSEPVVLNEGDLRAVCHASVLRGQEPHGDEAWNRRFWLQRNW